MTGVLNPVLQSFQISGNNAINFLIPYALHFLYMMICIDLAWGLCKFLLQKEENLFAFIARRSFLYGFLYWLIREWKMVTDAVYNSLVTVAVTAGGNVISITDFHNVDRILQKGLSLVKPILGSTSTSSSSIEVAWSLLNLILSGPSGIAMAMLVSIVSLAMMCVFIFIAIYVLNIQIQTYLITAFAIILVPFGANKHTAFLFQRVKELIPYMGIRYMIMAYTLSIAWPFMDKLKFPEQATLESVFLLFAESLTMAILLVRLDKVADSFYQPSMSARESAGAVMTMGAFAIGGAKLVGGAVSSGIGAVTGLMNGDKNKDDGGFSNTVKAATADAGTEGSSNMPGSFSSGGDNGASLASQMSADTIAENTRKG